MGLRQWSAQGRAWICAALAAAALGGCKGKVSGGIPADTAPFVDAAAPATYVPKVKTLLTGLPATDAEVQAVISNPAALRDLIDQWMTLPQFRGRMLDFFRTAFQQSNVTLNLFASSLGVPDFYVDGPERIENALMDSFPLTAWQLVQEGRPFNETVTTRRYMMTTAMMVTLAYADMYGVDDAGDRTERLGQATAQTIVIDPLATASAAESIAQFGPGRSGRWTWRLPVQNLTQACVDEINTRRTVATDPSYDPAYLLWVDRWCPTCDLFGLIGGNLRMGNGACAESGGNNVVTGLLQDDATVNDFADWRMVTIETIPIIETRTLPSPPFWDIPSMRAATTLRLKSPRLGFFGTPAWNANWPTNESNQARVTANQSLIVALGLSIIPAAAIAPAPVSASDAEHSANPACSGCHNVLDPLRQFFRQSYTFSYHEQRDLSQYLAPATFQLGGVTQTGRGIEDYASILASHPHYAVGWAQKLQFWANSNAAEESDPELQRIARAFQASNFDFRTLVREVFSSWLVTLAGPTQTYRTQGVTVGITRRDQLCAALSARLALDDACDHGNRWSTVHQLTQMIATDTYYRAAELPALPRSPDLFFRDSVEALCGQLADRVVGSAAGARFSTTNVSAAVADMVSTVMGIPPADPRSAPAAKILSDHYNAALTQDRAGSTSALRSSFVLACMSPTSVIVGL